MAMHDPPHPGEFITEVHLEPNNLSGREPAAKLGVTASTLNRILTGASGISPEIALRLSRGLGPFTRKLACDAVRLRSLAREATCEELGHVGGVKLTAT